MLKLTTRFKKAAFALFCKAFNFKSVGMSMIKRVFPAFVASSAIHWFNLIDKCESMITLAEVQAAKKSALEKAEAIKNAFKGYREVKLGSPEWFLGQSFKIYVHNLSVGTVGYSDTRESWYFETRSKSHFVPSLHDAVGMVFERCNIF